MEQMNSIKQKLKVNQDMKTKLKQLIKINNFKKHIWDTKNGFTLEIKTARTSKIKYPEAKNVSWIPLENRLVSHSIKNFY